MSAPNLIRAYEAKIDDVRSEDMSLVCRLNTADVDYYLTVLHPKGIRFDNYRSLGQPILWEHGKDLHRRFTDPIGNALWIKHNGGNAPTEIIAKPRFLKDDFSRQRWEWYRDEIIRGWSVNILPDQGSAGPPTKEELRARPDWESASVIYRSGNLIEFSGTVLPGNPRALTDSRAAKVMELVERNLLWLPEEAEPIYREAASRATLNVPLALERTTTDSLGGLSGGGATVKPDVRGEEEDEEDEGEEPRRNPGRKAKPSDEDEEDEDEDEAPPADAKRKPRPRPGGAAGHAEEPDEDEDDESAVKRFIRKKGSRFVIYSETGKKLGDYATREEAEHRLKQIEYFKHRDEGRRAAPSSKLDAIKEAIKGLPDLHPDYGQVFYDPDSDKVFINFSDSDDRDTTRKWVAAMAAIVGEDNVDGDAECGVEKYKSWIKVRSYAGPIRTDGRGGWSVHEPDGRVVATYRDRAVAEECLVAMGCSDGYERALLGLMAEQRARMEEQADDLIARIELRTLGRV